MEITVHGWDDLQQWLATEQAKWTWLVPNDARTDVASVAGQARNTWNTVMNAVNSVRASGHALARVSGHLRPFEVGEILCSESTDGSLVLGIRETAGDTSAANAYAFLRGILPLQEVRTRQALIGVLLTVLPDMRDAAALSDRLNRERRNYRQGLREAVTRLEMQQREQEDRFGEALRTGKRVAARALRRRNESWRKHQSDWQTGADAAVASIQNVERTYSEFMQLEAPVEYWRTKGSDHATKEGNAATRLAIVALVAAVVLVFAFVKASDFLIRNEGADGQAPVALYVIVSAGLALLSTVAFWIGRLFSKLYLSEHHLRNDAEERAVMAKTYLAISKETTVEPADRQIILSALFRNTPDGIVREDGPPDASPQALLSRLISGRP